MKLTVPRRGTSRSPPGNGLFHGGEHICRNLSQVRRKGCRQSKA